MRIAVKFAYDGRPFYGYARQPDLHTVEGVLLKTLRKTGFIVDGRSSSFLSASRTDKGVSACCNVVAFNTKKSTKDLLQLLSEELTDVFPFAMARVSDDFYPRHAQKRWYRYVLPKESIGLKTIQQCIDLFQGSHDFSNFARVESHKNPIRAIDQILVDEQDHFFAIDIIAQTFLWHQIRRMISAMIKVEKGKKTMDEVASALHHPEKSMDFGVAPAEPLILMDISYPNVSFKVDKMLAKKKERVQKKVQDRLKDPVF